MKTAAKGPSENERLTQVEALARQGGAGVGGLIELLTEPSWVVRRAVVAALSTLGLPAAAGLCEVLRRRRDSEARLAAAVDALSASTAAVDELVLELTHASDPAILCDAAAILGRRHSARAVPVLARLTTHGDDNVAVAAIEALGRIGGSAARDSLVATVASRNFFRTFPALDVLGRSGAPEALATIVGLLDDPLYTAEAARALGHTGSVLAVRPLLALLARASSSTLRVVGVALSTLHEQLKARSGSGAQVVSAVEAAGVDEAATRALGQAVAGALPEEQAALCRVLGWLRTEASVSALIQALEVAPEPAAAALRDGGRLDQVVASLEASDSARRLQLLPVVRGQPLGGPGAVACLEDRDPQVRAMAADVLARSGEVSAVPALFQLLADGDPGVVQAAVGALHALGSEVTEKLALEHARSPNLQVRRAALRLIGYHGPLSGLPVMLEAAGSEDERTREIALSGLALQDDPKALKALVAAADHPSPKTRAAAVRALGQVPVEPTSGKAIRARLADPDAWVRYYACQALGRRGEEDATPLLLPLLADPAGQVHVAVVDALARFQGDAAFDALQQAARSSDPDVRRAALLGLGNGDRHEALPALLEAAAATDANTRLVALSALSTHQSPRALSALLQAAHDVDPNVALAAVGFLSERSGVVAANGLIELLRLPVLRERVVAALQRQTRGRSPALLAALQTADETIAPLLAQVLATSSQPDSGWGLLATLVSGQVAARRAVASVLAGTSDPEAKALLEASAVGDQDLEVRRLCIAAIAGP